MRLRQYLGYLWTPKSDRRNGPRLSRLRRHECHGRTTGPPQGTAEYDGLISLRCTSENGFVPEIPKQPVDIIYLCYPNNPTGATATREQLTAWVEYALAHRAIIFFDAAYEAYITDPDLPHSIYEIPGARSCAIEFRSFSKNGGFTGVRCAFTVLPKEVEADTGTGEFKPLRPLWNRRFSTKFNGVGYPVQSAAAALYTPEGKTQVANLIEHYMGNAQILREAVTPSGLSVYGGLNAPYLWVKGPTESSSWDLFDRILEEINIVVTPGSGFGEAGEGYFRISAFNSRTHAQAARRFQEIIW